MKRKSARPLLLIITLVFLLAGNLYSQNIAVRAGFVNDSTRVGDDLIFYLAASYPRTSQVLFPDSTFSFAPFELRTKEYFPTHTRDTVSVDSAIYILRTFEIEKQQTLRLPVFVVNPMDCTRVFSARDTVALRATVGSLPDSLTSDLPLKATTAYQPVELELNVPMIVTIAAATVLTAGIAWMLFGPSLRKHYRIKRLKQMHTSFSANFDRHLRTIQTQFSSESTEAAVVEWKKYMEALSRRPFTKLTTRETTAMEQNEQLGRSLRNVDRAIYGGDTNVLDSLSSLKVYADERFNDFLNQVKNG